MTTGQPFLVLAPPSALLYAAPMNMVLYQQGLGWAGGLAVIVSLALYVRDVLRGRTHPHIFSWLIWGLLTGIAFFSQREGGAGPGALTTAASALGSFAIAVMSLFWGDHKVTRGDFIALTAALCVIPVWLAVSEPLVAIVLVTVIDACAFYPTFRRSWHAPFDECIEAYVLMAVGFALGLGALEAVTFTTALYPVALVILNSGFVVMALARRRKISGTFRQPG